MIKTIGNVGQYGVITDQQSHELPDNAWSDAVNVIFRDGCAERVRGQTLSVQTPSITPYYVDSFQTTINRFTVYAGTTKVFADNGTTAYDITNTTAPTGTSTDRWSGGTLNGILLLNNGIDIPQYWAGNTAVKTSNLTGWNSAWRCASLRPFKNYAIALNVTKSGTNYPHMVKWSDAAVPGAVPSSWDETDATKSAGEQDLSETPDLMVDCLQMGDLNIIYKERSMYSMQYIGQPYIWRFQRLPGSDGMLARGCAAAIPTGHVVLTAGDVVFHAGQGTQSIISKKRRKWLFANMDSSNYKNSFVVANNPKKEVWICFPTSGNTWANKALVWNWEDQTWGERELVNATYGASGAFAYTPAGLSWASDAASWSTDATGWNSVDLTQADTRLVIAGTSPTVDMVDVGTSVNGTAINAIVERTGLAFGDPMAVKTVKRVYPRIEGTAGNVVYIQVGGAMDVEGSITWSPAVPYTIGTTYHADAFATGRFLAIRFTSTGGDPWRIRSYDLDLAARGRF